MRCFSALLLAATLCLNIHHREASAACPCDECPSSSDCQLSCDSVGCACDSGCCDAACCDADCCERDRLLSPCSLLKGNPCSCNYFTLLGGWNGLHDYNGEQEIIPPPPTPVVRRGSFSNGWAIGGAIGRRFTDACRGELEFAFRSNTGDAWYVNGNPAGPYSGHFFSYALMGNLYRDFEACSALGWTPYVGGGIGIAFLDGKFTTSTLDLTIDDTEFAYQLMVGGSRQIRPGVEALMEYTYFGTTDFNLVNNTPMPPVGFGTDAYEADGLVFGLRWYR